ncbi:MAG TPA: MtrB/PioB family outer membrane beta-barrel protein, partial [Candidatus Polarisedimenticolia bacterium]|nr:MtrB/PioB family outer membrane beta-barrel protein [Candidatus Polarisedimenticolia bacterium]
MSSSSRRTRLLTIAAAAAILIPIGVPARAAEDDATTKPLATERMEWTFNTEVGYRTLSVDGGPDAEALYRSHTNLSEGARLFNLSLRGTPKGSEAGLFDTLELNAAGLGGDPQAWANFTLRKRGVYRWNVKYNRSVYFFDVPDFVRFGQHTNDNLRRTFDTLLELNPGTTRVYVGYTRAEFNGPAFLTQDEARDEFMVLAPVDRTTDDVRAGIDLTLGRWQLNLEQAYRGFDSKSDFAVDPASGAGNNPGNNATLTTFTRSVPLNGTWWVSRASAHASFAERVDLSIRFVYSDGKTDGNSTQLATGNWYTAAVAPFNEAILTDFKSDLPTSLGEVGVSIRLTDNVDLHNVVRYLDYQIDGHTDEQVTRDVDTADTNQTTRRLTDWTSWEARSEAEWRVDRRWTLRGGARRFHRDVSFENRDVLVDNTAATTTVTIDKEDGTQTADSYFGSVAFRYNARWSAFLELTDGETDNVFLRVDPGSYKQARLKGSYHPTERWSVSLTSTVRSSDNPNPDVQNKVNSRTYAADVSFNGKRLAFVSGYTAVNLDSSTDIVYCSTSPCDNFMDVSRWDFEDSHYFADVHYTFSKRFKGSLRGHITDSRGTFPVDYYYVEPRFSFLLYGGYWINLAW